MISRLFRLSSLIGLAIVIAVVAALSLFYRQLAFESIIDGETRANVALTKSFANTIWPRHSAFVIGARSIPAAELASRPELRTLGRDLRVLKRGLDVVKVKVFNLDGLTVYSSDPKQIGERQAGNPGFRTAAGGAPASMLTFRDRFDSWEGVIAERNIISSFVPVRADDNAPVQAVMEIYSDVTRVVERMERTQWQIVIGVIGATLLLYALILWYSLRFERAVRAQEAQRRVDEERVRYQAYHDALTGLPNRTSFAEHLEEAIRRARRAKWSLAVMFLDLDRFKVVNDSLGHDAGDTLLRAAADRLKSTLRESDLLFRMGGDEFTVLLENVRGPEEAAAVAARMIETIGAPVTLADHELHVSASIGISLYPKDDEVGERLVKSADAAMYRAKEMGRNRYMFFTAEMNERVESQLVLEASLQRAHKNGEFELHYQPRVDTDGRRVIGVEALLRWNHPESGLVLPARFIPTLEETGQIVQVGEWVLRAACRQNRAWQDAGLAPMRVSVNVSTRQFQSETLLQSVQSALEESGLDPVWLELELTESQLLVDTEAAIEVLAQLNALGVAISIDDFGSGYSSLNYLKRLPIDCLKIDQGFVRDLGSSAKDGAIVEAIAAVARSLNLGLVAEGVETAGQARFLRRLYCTEMQGYFYSRPVAAEVLPEIIAALDAKIPA